MDFLMTYLSIINAVGFVYMLVDKRRARQGRWRIPEATLMGIAAAGGSVGSLLGMYTFRHKTQHPKFTIGIPAILILQVAIAISIAIMIAR